MSNRAYGFIYNYLEEPDALQLRHLGQMLETDTHPWYVYRDVAKIHIKKWPGQLWFIEVMRSFSTTRHDYIPAIVIKPLKQLPCSLLFGPKGKSICLLLDEISQLTVSQVEQLAAYANPISEEAYSNGWNDWLNKCTQLAMHKGADHTATLAIGEGEEASPIYNGFLTIRDLVHLRAKELVGEEAFINLGNSDDVYLSTMWSKACSVLLQIAMGLGAEQYVDSKDLPLLLLAQNVINKV